MGCLSLSFSHLMELRYDMFTGRNLTQLLLGSNHSTSIEIGTFRDQKFLQHLHLAGNDLEVLRPATFIGLANLEYLGLDGNKLITLDTAIFYIIHTNVVVNVQYNPLDVDRSVCCLLGTRKPDWVDQVGPNCKVNYINCEGRGKKCNF